MVFGLVRIVALVLAALVDVPRLVGGIEAHRIDGIIDDEILEVLVVTHGTVVSPTWGDGQDSQRPV